jgi:hypothetical protein
MKVLFPGSNITYNTKVPSENIILAPEDKLSIWEFDVSFVTSFSLLILKIFLPHLSLAIEYQGVQHYISNLFGSYAIRQRRDQAKLKFASQLGITLISIPFWWDKSSESLASTIQYYRPDIHLQEKVVPPIPTEMPAKYKKHRM